MAFRGYSLLMLAIGFLASQASLTDWADAAFERNSRAHTTIAPQDTVCPSISLSRPVSHRSRRIVLLVNAKSEDLNPQIHPDHY